MCYNLGLTLIILSIEDLICNARFVQPLGDQLIFSNRARPHQHRPALLMVLLDGSCHGFELSLFGFVNEILVIFAGNWLVGRHYHHIQAVDLLELLCLSKGRTGHTTELLI